MPTNHVNNLKVIESVYNTRIIDDPLLESSTLILVENIVISYAVTSFYY